MGLTVCKQGSRNGSQLWLQEHEAAFSQLKELGSREKGLRVLSLLSSFSLFIQFSSSTHPHSTSLLTSSSLETFSQICREMRLLDGSRFNQVDNEDHSIIDGSNHKQAKKENTLQVFLKSL